MHLPTKQSDIITDIAIKSRSLTELFLQNLLPSGKPVELTVSNDVFEGQPTTRLFLVTEGQVFYRVRGKLVAVLEEGDLIGLTRSLNLNEGLFSCIEDVQLVPYDRDELIAHVHADAKLQKNWTHYLVCNIAFFQNSLAQEIRAEFQPQAGFVHFSEGETIIRQGDPADKVYTLLDGSADAICDGVKVGDVNANEIFGALAVFTRQPRIASVIATSDCTVLAVRKEEFIDLIDHQPQICLGLIEEMATKINQLNNQLLARQ
ncbi:MAG: cyclic nucleotide-binding domain-containing protein [Gammaproteobacteria bacterium]|nr:MAG: cyclic nucleotide-binding domain-containing protein [Gammaproteobacteria bacterium]